MKYVILENPSGLRFGIMFPDFLQHVQIVNNFSPAKPISAGFVAIEQQKCIAYGGAVSLSLSTAKEDSVLLTKEFFGD